jgi:hypothetical protein
MKRSFFALAVIVLSASAVSGQEWAEKIFIKDDAPHLTHDFGVVAPGTVVHHAFPVTNIYDVPLEIVSVQAMGIVTAVARETKLGPCKSTVIDVYLDAHRFRGPKTVAVWVKFGAPYTISTAKLVVSANCREALVCNPTQVQFGTVPCGQERTETVELDHVGGVDWRVTKVIAPPGGPFNAAVKETHRRDGAVGYRLTVTLKGTAAAGTYWENVHLETNDPGAGLLEIPIRAIVEAPLSVGPASVNVGKVAVGQTVTRKVLVHGNKPFVVRGIEGPENVKLEGKPNTSANHVQIVTLQISPVRAGAFHHEIKIKTDLQDTPVIVVVAGVGTE